MLLCATCRACVSPPLEAEAHCEHDAVVVVLDLGIHAWLGIADAHDGREGVVLAGAPLVHIGHVGVEALVVIAKTQREVLDALVKLIGGVVAHRGDVGLVVFHHVFHPL